MARYQVKDPSWIVIFFNVSIFFPPLGFIAIIVKIVYQIVKTNNAISDQTKSRVYETSRDTEVIVEEQIRNEAKQTTIIDAPNVREVEVEPLEVEGVVFDESTDDVGAEVVEEVEDIAEDIVEVKVSQDTEDVEEVFDVEEVYVDDKGRTAIKVLTCSMCDTKNPIYEVNRFETPTCSNCGKLLFEGYESYRRQ